jgi:hypothetical protein
VLVGGRRSDLVAVLGADPDVVGIDRVTGVEGVNRLVVISGVVLALGFVGCGSGESSTSPGSTVVSSGSKTASTTTTTRSVNTQPAKPPSPPAPQCITGNGYAGLYSTVEAFNAGNLTTEPPQPQLGVAVFHVLSTTHGCVSAYSVEELTSPPQAARDIVFLTDGIALPDDHTQPVESGGCTVYSSPTLTKASGFKFARADGTAQIGNTPAQAEIHLTNAGSC